MARGLIITAQIVRSVKLLTDVDPWMSDVLNKPSTLLSRWRSAGLGTRGGHRWGALASDPGPCHGPERNCMAGTHLILQNSDAAQSPKVRQLALKTRKPKKYIFELIEFKVKRNNKLQWKFYWHKLHLHKQFHWIKRYMKKEFTFEFSGLHVFIKLPTNRKQNQK